MYKVPSTPSFWTKIRTNPLKSFLLSVLCLLPVVAGILSFSVNYILATTDEDKEFSFIVVNQSLAIAIVVAGCLLLCRAIYLNKISFKEIAVISLVAVMSRWPLLLAGGLLSTLIFGEREKSTTLWCVFGLQWLGVLLIACCSFVLSTRLHGRPA